jgi:probable HAF family extracellular repeat protein
MLRSMIGAAVAALSAVAALAAPVYKIEAIPSADEFVPARATAINRHGDVVGQADTPDGQQVSFKYSNGQLSRLADDLGVGVLDINDAGDTLGQAAERNVVWRADGTREELGTTSLKALNRHGDAAGWYWFPGDVRSHASFYKSGCLTDLGGWDGGDRLSIGNGINDLGQVVGVAYFENNRGSAAVVWENGVIRHIEGLPGEAFGEGIAINAKGHVVGTSSNFGWSDGFIHDGSARVLPGIKSKPFIPAALNNRDVVVGTVAQRAALSIRGKSYMLKSLLNESGKGWMALEAALDINDRGQIVGVGVYRFQRRAFIATPVKPNE